MKHLPISPVDTIFANGSYPIEFLFYFRNRLDSRKIRRALSKLSDSFWPAFGEYRSGAIHFDRYSENDCFDVEEEPHDFNQDLSDRDLYNHFSGVIPSGVKKLFFFKLLQYHNGTVLIVKMNHLVGDGYSYFYLLSLLATLSRGPHLPFRDWIVRTLAQPKLHRNIGHDHLLKDVEIPPPAQEKEWTLDVRKISRKSVQDLARQATDESALSLSTNDVLSAMVVRQLAEMKHKIFGENFDLFIPIDVRRMIKAYGPRYFGNGLMFHSVRFKTAEIIVSDLQYLARKIRQGFPRITSRTYLEYLEGIESLIHNRELHRLRPYDPRTGCLVTNLSKLPVHKLDFGTGIPETVFPLTIGKNAAAIMADQEDFILRIVY